MTSKKNLGKTTPALRKLARSLSRLKEEHEREITCDGKWIWPPGLRAALRTFEGLYFVAFKKPDRKKPLLIMGETGVGKSAFVDIFEKRYEMDHPDFSVAHLNLATIPENLIEGELFGHEKGAFTGATKGYPGIIGKLKDGDLLILEEIGELGPSLQVKLLTFIEDGRYYRLHDTSFKNAKNIQIVGTTNKNSEDESLRKDFIQRFLTFHVPALRKRRNDIAYYAEQLCPEGWALIKNEGRTGYLGQLSDDAIAVLVDPKKRELCTSDAERELLGYSWPGNVRQLINVLEMLNAIFRTWTYKPVSDEEEQSLSFTKKVSRVYERQADLYSAVINTFSVYDPIIIKIALRVLAPDERTKKQFLRLGQNAERLNSKEPLPKLEEILMNGPAVKKEDLLKAYYVSIINRTNGNQKQAAKLAGLSESALCSALKKFAISKCNSKNKM